MLHERPAIERRVHQALDAEPHRIPVLLGTCGSGRTSILNRVADQLGAERSRYVDAERVASTPERLLATVAGDPMSAASRRPTAVRYESPRAAFDALLAHIGQPQHRGQAQPILLFDEFIELRTLVSYPGLRGVLSEFLGAAVCSSNRFVFASRYTARALRLLETFPADRFEVIHLPPLDTDEVHAALRPHDLIDEPDDRTSLATMVQAITGGRPAWVQHLATSLAAADGPGAADPAGALAAQMAPGAPLANACRFTYELRLHRARGYGALKGILAVLADEEPLTLTGIARRLGRTPGSTRDYLAWLADVDLITVEDKRYRYIDPILRLWVRLHCHAAPPDRIALAREVQDYVIRRLPPVTAAVTSEDDPDIASPAPRTVQYDFIEID